MRGEVQRGERARRGAAASTAEGQGDRRHGGVSLTQSYLVPYLPLYFGLTINNNFKSNDFSQTLFVDI